MEILTFIFFGFIIAAIGSITPSFLNLTVIKFSLESGKRSALFLIAGYATVLFFQANIGAYLANVLMSNSEYITKIQILGTVILFLLSIYFFRSYFNKSSKIGSKKVVKSKAYLYGITIAALNMMAIPFYFTTISFLIGLDYFRYSFINGIYFSIGSTIGSFSLYSTYAYIAAKIENKIPVIASKMDFILGCITSLAGIVNLISLL